MSVNISDPSATIKSIEKLGDAIVSLKVLEAAIKAGEAEKERMQEESAQKAASENTKSNKDTAQIADSDEEKQRKVEQTKLLFQCWKMEVEEKAWKEILDWKPDSKKSLDENIQQFKEIYTELKNQILKYTTGEELNTQLNRLEKIVMQSLEQLTGTKIDDLIKFMGKFGQNDTLAVIKASLFQMITGQSLTLKDAALFLNFTGIAETQVMQEPSLQKNETEQKLMKNPEPVLPEKGKTAAKQTTKEGMIYQRSGGSQISINKSYSVIAEKIPPKDNIFSHQQDAVKMDNILSFQKGSREERITTRLFSTFDMERTARFVQHISEEGIPFEGIQLAKSNEELAGVLTGILALKTQVFSVYSGISDNMATALRSAVDDLIACYLYPGTIERENETKYVYNDNRYLKSKDVLRVYNYILGMFDETKNPKEAILKGIAFALQIFKQKEEEKEQNGDFSNRKKGFFFGADSRKGIMELREGLRVIRENWNRFIKKTGLKLFKLDADFEKNSLWGAIAKPKLEQSMKQHSSAPASGAALWGVILMIVSVGGVISLFLEPPFLYFYVGGGIFAALLAAVMRVLSMHKQ